MKKSQKLLLGRNIFASAIIIIFTIIVINEKGSTIFLPKVEEKMNEYIKNNYADIENDISYNKITYNKTQYTMKVKNKSNKNLYFYIYYSNKKITDTYKKDYLKGETLLKHIKKDLTKEINTKTNQNCSIEIVSTLDSFTPQVKERIINEDNLSQLKFYSIKKELFIKNWNEKEIATEISSFINSIKENNITPKYYTITITDKADITKSIKIDNLTDLFITNKNQEQIISAIINDEKSQLLTDQKIEYTYLN